VALEQSQEVQMQQPLKNTVLVGPSPRIAVDYSGAGQPIIFLHGIGGNRLNWARAMAALSPQFLVMAWDARGYGASDDYPGALTDDDFIADLARVLDHFEIDQCHIVGLSMGVSIAIDFFDQHPDRVKSLVFSGGSTEDGHPAKKDREAYLKSRLEPLLNGADPADRAGEMLNSLIADISNKTVVQEAVQSLRALRRDSYIKSMQCYAATQGRSHKFANVTVPALGIVGELDRLTTPENMAELVALIQGLNSRLSALLGTCQTSSNQKSSIKFSTIS
jgi:3-oxoadipate enol-lactonase